MSGDAHIAQGLSQAEYLALAAIGSSHLSWLAVSPRYYQWRRSQPPEVTPSLELGTAVHALVLEAGAFADRYVIEPDPWSISPEATSPRATKAFKEALARLKEGGKAVLKTETMEAISDMRLSVSEHRHASALLSRCPQREVTMLWDRDGRQCRARADLLGDGVMADLKTTRSLRGFSPFGITSFGYHRQAAWYMDGAARCGLEIQHFMLIAVETSPPYDCGVFALDPAALSVGAAECDAYMRILSDCEASGEWPGMFPNVQPGAITDAAMAQLEAYEEVA